MSQSKFNDDADLHAFGRGGPEEQAQEIPPARLSKRVGMPQSEFNDDADLYAFGCGGPEEQAQEIPPARLAAGGKNAFCHPRVFLSGISLIFVVVKNVLTGLVSGCSFIHNNFLF